MNRLYFAHNMIDYGTKKEKRELKAISEWVGDKHKVVNPAKCDKEFYATNPDERSFSFWYKKVESCDMLVYTTTSSGYIGRGVLAEMTHAFKKGIEVWHLTKNGSFLPQSSHITGMVDLSSGKYYFKPMVVEKTERGFKEVI